MKNFNIMKKFIIAMFIITFLIILGYFVFWGVVAVKVIDVAGEFNSKTESLKELVGESVIIKDDTLLIIDYSSINNTFTLDDNRTVDVNLVKKLKKITNETK